jgi:fructose-1,6-bisphosphatase
MAKGKGAQFVLAVKENTYKGETYENLVGSFICKGERILISVNPKEYESKDGTTIMYARAVNLGKDGQRKRRNEI